jgi:hypothetical protein
MGNFLRKMDKIGPEMGYNFGRRPRFESPIGGIFTILAYTFICYVGYQMITKIFDTKQVDVEVVESFTSNFPEVNLYQNNFYPMFTLYQAPLDVLADDIATYVYIKGEMYEYNYT